MKKTIFLSGAMRGVPRIESLGWRIEAKKLLSDSFHVIHALRGREQAETMPSSKGAVIRDTYDIRHSDVLLVNDSFVDVSMIGTSMEIHIAYESKIPVIVFGDAHKGDYWMDYHSHVRVETLGEACSLLRDLFAR
jgi:hypothetical protein